MRMIIIIIIISITIIIIIIIIIISIIIITPWSYQAGVRQGITNRLVAMKGTLDLAGNFLSDVSKIKTLGGKNPAEKHTSLWVKICINKI